MNNIESIQHEEISQSSFINPEIQEQNVSRVMMYDGHDNQINVVSATANMGQNIMVGGNAGSSTP